MSKENRKRYILVAGLVLFLLSLYFTGAGAGPKTAIAATIAGLGLFGNAYGIWRPTAWLR